ncbi:MAG: FkbM family methyltransferase [Caulobacter sp.]
MGHWVDDFWRQAARLRGLARNPLTRGYAKRRFGRLCGTVETQAIPFDADIAGLPVSLDLKQPADREVYLFGRGDPRGVGAIEAVMARLDCRTAWDVGTNRGIHAAFMRRHCNQLYAFEPNPVEFRRASDLLGADDHITLLNLGLSNQDGELPFLIHSLDTGGSTFVTSATEANFVAPVRTGDSVVAEHGVTGIDFIKIDVEGYEKNVLRGLAGTIAADRPVIVVEILAPQNSELDNIVGLLPDYELFGNRTGFVSSILMTPYSFCPFELGKTYMSALLVPREKRDRLASLLPA